MSTHTVVHFGCGRLGLGAVLPFIVERYGSSRIVAVQRRSSAWKDVPSGVILPLRTTAGDFLPFRTVVLADYHRFLEEYARWQAEQRILVLLPSIGMATELLNALSENGKSEVLVSCALGAGQSEIVQLLRVCPHWNKVLIFENTMAGEWDSLGSDRLKTCHHILVDRICWYSEGYSTTSKRSAVLCHCEESSSASFSWPRAADIPEPSTISSVSGELVQAGWKCEVFDGNEQGAWRRLRKRALINAPHAVTGLLCYRLLAIRGMDPDKQYLAPLQEMLRADHADWWAAMDLYLRLRAIEVAWGFPGTVSNGVIKAEPFHRDYDASYRIARTARRRFFATNDRLDRLMNPGNLAKELAKFDEHILKPLTFYERERERIMSVWLYGRRDPADFGCLRGFLTETFLEATQWLASALPPARERG